MSDDGDRRQQEGRDDRVVLQPAPNATMWGFAVEALHLLYRIGPATIVVAGFLVFGYFFYQEVNRAKEQVDKQLLERLKTSQEQLVATYEKMGVMSDKLIQNVQSLLDLSDRIDEDIEANRGRLKKLEEETEERVRETEERSAKAKQKADEALAEADAATAEVAKLNDDIMARQDELAQREAALQEQLQALEGQRNELEVQVTNLKAEREKHKKALADSAAQIAQLRPDAAAATGDGGLSIKQTVQQLLAAFAEDPRGSSVDDLKDLIGMDLAVVAPLARANADYAAWYQTDIRERSTYLNGLVGDSAEEIDANLSLTAGEGRIVRVEVSYGLVVTELPKIDNWYETWTALLWEFDNGLQATYIDQAFGSWTLAGASQAIDPRFYSQLIAGSEQRKSVMAVGEVAARHPDTYGRWAEESDSFGRPAVILSMMKRAEEFQAASLAGAETLTPELLDVFVPLLEAAVADRQDLVQTYIDPSINRAKIGALAALALRQGVRVDSVQENDISDRGGNTIGTQAVVTLSFPDRDTKTGERLAPLNFRRETGPWKLTAVSIYF